ncbi:polysaccharide biosynthesis tyrosine autokinase [Deinococcus peraridilitoris]|nr:tyrosine-protein kinase domain-containing protein [Deinococcus peraridilitoris]
MTSPSAPRPDEIDLRQVFQALRRHAPLIALTSALAAGGTFLLSKQQAPVYRATTSVMAGSNEAGNSLINNTLVTAPPLPQGALQEALHSRRVVGAVLEGLEKTDLPPDVVAVIRRDLQNELADNVFRRFTVKARLDPQQRGVYEISATGSSPEAARTLAEVGVTALLDWDTARAQAGVSRARRSVQAQLRDTTARLQAAPAGSLDRQSLIAARGQLLQNLSQVTVLEAAASGTLSLVAEPVAPRRPVAPRPTRNAALAGLLALFLSSGLALLSDSLRRRVNGTDDLLALGLPVLGQLPLVQRKHLQGGFVAASESGPLYESVGFLRINLLSVLPGDRQRRLVVSSAHASEGKSSLTAALAANLASGGLRVLVIDADLRRPTQFKVWAPEQTELVALPGAQAGQAPVATLSGAFLQPEAAHAVRVSEGVDLLPAGKGARGGEATNILNQPALPKLLERWAAGYDVVLIDSPPMLSLPDTLSLARNADGVLLVVEAGKTRLSDVERSLENARTAGVGVLGLALNKLPRNRSSYYGYGYGEEEQKQRFRGLKPVR